MNVILILLAASLTIAIGFLAAFIWSVKTGQYEDDYTPSVRMLFDDEKPAEYSATERTLVEPENYMSLEATAQKPQPFNVPPDPLNKKTNHTK